MTRRLACGIALAVAVLTAGHSPAPAAVSLSLICADCLNAANDTSFTPGMVSVSRSYLVPILKPPIAFIDGDQHLRCAMPTAAGWTLELVDPLAEAAGCSIDLDDAGEPIIAYHDSEGFLHWAQRSGGDWTKESVGMMRGVFGSTSIARVPNGVGVAFVASGVMRYAERVAGGSWVIEGLGLAGGPEAYPSLVVDGSVRAVSYYDVAHGDLRLAQRVFGVPWSNLLVDSAGDVGGYTSLIGSATQGFGIAYYDFTNEDLRYAHDSPTGWQFHTPDGADAAVGRFCSATTFTGTPEDYVGIAYYDQTAGDLRYALKRGGWSTGVLDDAGDTGVYVAAGRPPGPESDSVGVAYVQLDSHDLYYRVEAGTVADAPNPRPVPVALRVEWRRGTGGGGRVRFVVPVEGPVRVTLHDAAGRLAAIPWRGRLSPGPAEIGWDGRDHDGRPMPSGVYFVRVETAAGTAAVRALVLR